MDFKLLDQIAGSFNVELPRKENMDQYLDWILPKVRPWSEDLREEKFYLHIRWMEISDQDDFQESVLHIFRPGGEYLMSIDGDIIKGSWQILEVSNTFIWERPVGGAMSSELYDLVFLDKTFFILKKHGDQSRKGHKRYFVMGRENNVARITWREAMELLFNNYRDNSSFLIYALIFGVIIILVLIFSLL